MLTFLGVAAGMFVLCWIWVGGYIADFVIWVISKFVGDSTNEKNVAIGVGVVAAVIGIIVAVAGRGDASAGLGGGILGVGAYIAVRLPGKVNEKRAREEAKLAALRPMTPYSTPLSSPVVQPAALPVAPMAPVVPSVPYAASTSGQRSPIAEGVARYCSECGTAVGLGDRFAEGGRPTRTEGT